MKTISAILFSIFFCLTAKAATPKIVLLTSIDPEEGKSIFHSSGNWDLNREIEKVFLKRFKNSGYQISIKHKADLIELRENLLDPEVAALFFLSHVAPSKELSNNTIKTANKIIDINGNDLKLAFQNIHPNMRYLAVIGCQGKNIIDSFRSLGVYDDNPNLFIKTFDQNIKAIQGFIDLSGTSALDEAINDSLPFISEEQSYDDLFPRSNPCGSDLDGSLSSSIEYCKNNYVKNRAVIISKHLACNFIPSTPILTRQISDPTILRVTRKIPFVEEANIYPVFVTVNEKNIAFFPKGNPGEIQVQEILVPKEIESKNITIDSGVPSAKPKNKVSLGEFTFEINHTLTTWHPERNHKGEVMGIGKNYYRPNKNSEIQ